MTKPIEQRVRVETWYVVCIEDEDGKGSRRLGGMFDFGPGKRGLNFPLEQLRANQTDKAEAEKVAKLARAYFSDVKEIPKDKRAGSSKHWK